MSLRQSSEWDMRALKRTFIRMKSRLPAHKRNCKVILTIFILLHNFRTQVVGRNQIAIVFNFDYDAYVSIRIAQYYEQEDNTDGKLLIISLCLTFIFNIFEKFITHFGRQHEL